MRLANGILGLVLLLAACVIGAPVLGDTHAPEAAAESGEASQAPTLDQIILLRTIGFNEAQIRAEIEPFAAGAAYPEDAAGRLRAAGFSDGFVAYLTSLGPTVTLDNAAIARLLDEGQDTLAILDAIAKAERGFDTSATGMLALREGRSVPIAITKAMLGVPLSLEDIRLLAAGGTPAAEQLRLIELLGHEVALDDAGTALELAQAGVPADVLAALRGSRQIAGEAEPESLAEAGTASDPAIDEELERFTHVTNLFSIGYPRSWFFNRYIEGDATIYQATPERPRGAEAASSLEAGSTAVSLRYWLRDKATEGTETDPVDLLATGLSRFYAHRLTELEPQGEPEALTIDGRPAAYRDYTATVDGQPIGLRWYLIVADDHFVGVLAHAGADAFADRQPLFARLAEAVALPGSPFPERRVASYSSSELTARYRKAVVAILVSDDDRTYYAGGSGFFIRGDGYLLTNHHVVYNKEQERFWRYFRIRWSTELDLEDEHAELIDSMYRESTIRAALNTGEDLALLKVGGIGPYDTVPLSPLEHTQVGDPLITIGFPLSGRFDSRMSTTVSTGVVTRFNRDVDDRIETIITDAKIAPGNSGGPAISLVTGGAIGLNTITVSQLASQAEDRQVRESVGYAGIMPVDRALERFPQATVVTAQRDQALDATDAFELASYAFQKNWRSGAIRLAQQAIERAPASPGARHLHAQILLSPHADRTNDDQVLGRRELDRALALDDSFQAALFTKADYEIERKEYLEAIKAVNRAIEDQPTWMALTKRARIYATMEQEDDALADLERAKTLGGGTVVEPYLLAGEILYKLERHEDGLAEYRAAVAMAPTNVAARLGVGRYYLNTERYLAALLEFDAIREDERREPDVYAAIGQTYARQGDHQRAVNNFRDAVNYYYDAARTPPADVLAEAAETAADKQLNHVDGVWLYSLYLGHYYDERGTLAGHRYLAGRFRDDGAIRRAHLIRAIELKGNTNDDERKQFEEQLQPVREARLELADIRKLRENFYHSRLIVRLIDDNPGNFTLAGANTGPNTLDEERSTAYNALVQEFGRDIASAIYYKVRGAELDAGPANRQEQQEEGERRTVELVGLWARESADGRRAELVLDGADANFSYRIDEIQNGQRRTLSEGRWQLADEGNQQVIELIYQQDGAERRARLPLRAQLGATAAEDRIFLTQGGQEREYRRA